MWLSLGRRNENGRRLSLLPYFCAECGVSYGLCCVSSHSRAKCSVRSARRASPIGSFWRAFVSNLRHPIPLFLVSVAAVV